MIPTRSPTQQQELLSCSLRSPTFAPNSHPTHSHLNYRNGRPLASWRWQLTPSCKGPSDPALVSRFFSVSQIAGGAEGSPDTEPRESYSSVARSCNFTAKSCYSATKPVLATQPKGERALDPGHPRLGCFILLFDGSLILVPEQRLAGRVKRLRESQLSNTIGAYSVPVIATMPFCVSEDEEVILFSFLIKIPEAAKKKK